MATPTLGFEINDHKEFSKVALNNGKVEDEAAEYVSVTENNAPSVAIRLFYTFYIFDFETQNLEQHDLSDEELTIVDATPVEIKVIEKNTYIKQFPFDCIKDGDQQNQSYQPISGLMTNSSYLTLKTHVFNGKDYEPKPEDLLFYQNQFWMIEDTSKTYYYTPREQSVLHISIKAINK